MADTSVVPRSSPDLTRPQHPDLNTYPRIVQGGVSTPPRPILRAANGASVLSGRSFVQITGHQRILRADSGIKSPEIGLLSP